MAKYKIECVVKTRRKIQTKFVRELANALFKKFQSNRFVKKSRPGRGSSDFADLTIAFVDKPASRKLNKAYRGKDYATDVLSFSPEAAGQGLGELVLCEPVLRRQAREHGHDFRKETEYMVIHGFLHLLGYDHEKSRKEELKMMRLQDKLFATLTK